MKKWLLPLLATTLFTVACDDKSVTQNNQTNNQSTTAQNPQKDELTQVTVVAPWELNSLHPTQSGIIFQRMNLAETLVEANEKGELAPGLATEWQSNNDATEWTFTLRDAVFHNGEKVTAQTVVKNLTLLMAHPSILQKAFIQEISALNANQVKFKLTKPFVPFPSFLTHYSTIILANEAFNEKNEVVRLIGTGAFKATKVEAPQKIEAVRFEQYWGEKPQVLHANYLASSRSETRVLMAQSDETSLVFNLDAASTDRLKTDPNLTLTSGSIARTIQMKMDVAKPFFNDLVIRQALSQAINRKAIAEQVLKIEDGVADQILPKAFADWRVESKDVDIDVAKIKQNLTAAGYQFNHEGKLTDKAGKPFSFTLRTFSDRPELPIIATILQAQWRQIGIDVNVSVGNFSEIPAGHKDGSLEMALYALNYGKTIDPFGIIVQDYAKGGSDWGVMNWHNEQLAQTLAQIETERDPQKAKQLKQTVSQIIHDELPIIPVVYYQQNVATHNEFKGVTLDPFERRFFLEKLTK
ncbi:ABC transporter substrate-binding protein [Actinobacillus genomosp. 2]|uniref:ABC transporter substrate-binding protein n=1 Tax=Actinobacillus genomosp. 2 TaxID=230709 RepID=UPI0024421ECB|nr:ABC transporter substrate-binding protein [Actinobacillus genomosp. 2]WGE31310.1 ABC transporter substrate-binding protein [Actinobacillus genomosp. 2]